MIRKKNSDIKGLLDQIVQPVDIHKEWRFTNDYYEWYYTYGWHFMPQRILEFGVRYGYSLASLIHGCFEAGGKVQMACGVDLEKHEADSNRVAKESLVRLFPRLSVDLRTMNTLDVRFDTFGRTFDLIHMDAHHNEESLQEFEIIWPLLEKGGVLIIDDMTSSYNHGDPAFCRTEKELVGGRVEELFNSGEIESYTHINSLRGHYVVVKRL